MPRAAYAHVRTFGVRATPYLLAGTCTDNLRVSPDAWPDNVSVLLTIVITPVSLSPVRRQLLPLHSFVAVCVAFAVIGFLLAVGIATHVPDEGERRASAVAVGEPVATSFGTLSVRDVDQIVGLGADDLGGGDHAAHTAGVNDLVPADQVQIIASVLVTNQSRRAVELSADAFGLITATSDTPASPLGDTLASASLRPGASVDLAVRFAVPRDNARLWLEFHDPNGSSPARS
jgi:hypothetical protein